MLPNYNVNYNLYFSYALNKAYSIISQLGLILLNKFITISKYSNCFVKYTVFSSDLSAYPYRKYVSNNKTRV